MTRIGVFDSGIGGFSILSEILSEVPGVLVDYISDDLYAPYGTKSDGEITERSLYITGILLQRGADLVVAACNSATAAAISHLREKHPSVPFVGVEPYINVLNHESLHPGITKAAVITTVLTGNSVKFRELKKRLDPEQSITHLTMPNLATIVERILQQGYTAELRRDLTGELEPLKGLNLSHLILGCTHYPLIANLIEEFLGVKTISPGPGVARRVRNLLPSPAGPPSRSFSFLSTSSGGWREMTHEELFELMKYGRTGDNFEHQT